MSDYDSRYSGQQIDTLLGKVESPDSTPTSNSQSLITSGGVKSALDGKANASSLGDTNTRLSAVEGKIPASATSANKLVDKQYVDDAVNGFSLKEDKANKVTSLSPASTNTQYPSAKCVHDIFSGFATVQDDTLVIKNIQ